ncbi:WD-repeat family protein [Cotonvirus japonicus]|uniref:WD-repeat family protein n=1 Tax=Cotonvirus japonicus TaxID=2811091 RepID=A0ABM7NQY6_9VIRU|nr:WD-repeat family protein [Cotonvirus japonicus]BCS82516.1 WD-repeat family protein [Cotonvirus japonicus]
MNSIETIKLIIRDEDKDVSLICEKRQLRKIKYFDVMFDYKENFDEKIIINVSNAFLTYNILIKYLGDKNIIKNSKWMKLVDNLKLQNYLMLESDYDETLNKLMSTNILSNDYADFLKNIENVPYSHLIGKLLIKNLPNDYDINTIPIFHIQKIIEIAENSYNILTIDNGNQINKWSSLNFNLNSTNNELKYYHQTNRFSRMRDDFVLTIENTGLQTLTFYKYNQKIYIDIITECLFGIDIGSHYSVISGIDKKYILSHDNGAIELLEFNDNEKSYQYSSLGYDRYIPIKFFPDELNILSVTKTKNISVWNSNDKKLKYFITTKNEILDLACCPNNKLFASCGDDNNITLWNREFGEKIKVLYGHDAQVTCIIFSSNGKYLASGSNDKTIKLWNIESEKPLKTFKGHTNNITLVRFTPDDKYIISSGWDKSMKIWNIESGLLIGEIKNNYLIQDIIFKYEPDDLILKRFN